MTKPNIKEYEINEGMFIIYNTLSILYQNYQQSIPKNFANSILNLLNKSERIINKSNTLSEKLPLAEIKYVKKVKY